MTQLDDKIRQALADEDADLFVEPEGLRGIFDMITESFRGKMKWLSYMAFVFTLAIFVGAIYAAVQFFDAETTREMIAWAIAVQMATLAVAMLKLWFWMEMNKNAVKREIKRLELQIARLAGRLGG